MGGLIGSGTVPRNPALRQKPAHSLGSMVGNAMKSPIRPVLSQLRPNGIVAVAHLGLDRPGLSQLADGLGDLMHRPGQLVLVLS